MTACAACTGLLLVLTGAPAIAATPVGREAVVRSGPSDRVDVRLFDLSAIRRLFLAVARQGTGMSEGERVAAWADFSQVTEAVLGNSQVGPFTFDELARAATSGAPPHAFASPGVTGRDATAYQLLSVGYSPRETADVVSGRISLQALDTARRMVAVGQSREAAANYLDTQYKLAIAAMMPPRAPSREWRGASTAFDAIIDHYAGVHNVEGAIVRAIIATESAFNPAARSPKGAIGLMQLMPMTARELGVNPFEPEQNIEGGIRYFSQLVNMFGGVELALVAYNAGPGFAQRYARGQAVLYGETREYVRRVLARMANLR